MRGTGTLVGLWLLAAAVATTIGFAAVSLVGGDLRNANPISAGRDLPIPPATPTPTPPQTQTPTTTTTQTQTPTSTTTQRPTTSAPATAETASVQRARVTQAGTVTARCTGSLAWLVSWSPDPGWVVDEVRRGPASEAEVRFESASDRVRVKVECLNGVPAFVVDRSGSGGDDGGSGSDDNSGSGSR